MDVMDRQIELIFNRQGLKRFYLPTRFIWGEDAFGLLGELIDDTAKVMLFLDRAFVRDPLILALRERLGDRLLCETICHAMPQVQELQRLAAAHEQSMPDIVLSIGGGSTVDAAKAVIAQWIFGTFDGVGMGARRVMPRRAGIKRPTLIGVPTTAGTGADVSRYYVTYDATTKGKVHGKSWDLVADWILIDPYFLRTAPDHLVVISAFDAFIHLFETFICRGERSWFGDMVSLEGITRLMLAMHAFLDHGDRSDQTLLALNYAAAIGGIGISNIRTGNIHEAAGALLELTPLTHADTLMVFMDAAIAQYREAIEDREALLMRHLSAHAPALGYASLDDIRAWWRRSFVTTGRMELIQSALSGITDWTQASHHIRERVWNDRVWCEKESPIPLTAVMVDDFLKAALPLYVK
jgi:alcohol dehydrogenase class IV